MGLNFHWASPQRHHAYVPERIDEQHPDARQKEIRAGVPEIVDGIELRGTSIEPEREFVEAEARGAEDGEGQSFVLARPIAEDHESDGETGERKCRPRKEREKPRLRLVEGVDAVDIGLEIPREPARAGGGPEEVAWPLRLLRT